MTTGRHRFTSGLAPVRKVGAGAIAGAVATLIVWGLHVSHIEVTPELAAAITTLVSAVVAYLVPSAPGEGAS